MQLLASQSTHYYARLVQQYEQRSSAGGTPATPATVAAQQADAPVMSRAAADANSETAVPRQPQARQLELHKRQVVRELAARDREVRTHEQAHLAAGGDLAGNLRYEYVKGPDRKQYAVGGEVDIDIAPVPGDPAATLDKARQIQRAALAPAQPSAQDRRVAAAAAQMALQAQQELLQMQLEAQAAARGGDVAAERSIPSATAEVSPQAQRLADRIAAMSGAAAAPTPGQLIDLVA